MTNKTLALQCVASALQFGNDNKHMIINGKIYSVAGVAVCICQNCNGWDRTRDSVASVAHSFRSATLQRDVCRRFLPKTFAQKVSEINCLQELNGFANRRRVLQVDLHKWTEEERRLILARKYELERKR